MGPLMKGTRLFLPKIKQFHTQSFSSSDQPDSSYIILHITRHDFLPNYRQSSFFWRPHLQILFQILRSDGISTFNHALWSSCKDDFSSTASSIGTNIDDMIGHLHGICKKYLEDSEKVFRFTRSNDTKEILVLLSFSKDYEKVELPEEFHMEGEMVLISNDSTAAESLITLPPYGAVVLIRDK